MSLLFLTGFDYFNTGQTNRIWPYVVGNGTAASPGRFAGQCWSFNNVGSTSYIGKNFTNSTTVFLGVAFNMASGDATLPIIQFMDGTSSLTNPTPQVDLRVTNDAGFQFTRNGVVIATTLANMFNFGFWNYLEVRVTISGTVGVVQLRLNGATYLDVGALNTKNTGNNYVNMLRLQPFANSGSYQLKFDDLYLCNDVGSVRNGFLGECRVQTQYPSANGAVNDFTATGAANNWQAVRETIMDDDATYVSSGVVGNTDLYAMGSVSFTGTVFGVQVNVTHRKDDVGTRTITPVVKSGSTTYEGDLFTCQSDYTTASKIWEQDPNGTTNWTNSSINALNAGLRIKA
jgi:hypothetical protein